MHSVLRLAAANGRVEDPKEASSARICLSASRPFVKSPHLIVACLGLTRSRRREQTPMESPHQRPARPRLQVKRPRPNLRVNGTATCPAGWAMHSAACHVSSMCLTPARSPSSPNTWSSFNCRLFHAAERGFDHFTRPSQTVPSAPRGWGFVPAMGSTSREMNSASVTHDSFAVMAAAPKFPSITPRSGNRALSVRRMTCSVCGSTWAMNSGARFRGM